MGKTNRSGNLNIVKLTHKKVSDLIIKITNFIK